MRMVAERPSTVTQNTESHATTPRHECVEAEAEAMSADEARIAAVEAVTDTKRVG